MGDAFVTAFRVALEGAIAAALGFAVLRPIIDASLRPANGAEQLTLIALGADVRHRHAQAQSCVVFLLALLDGFDGVGAQLNIRVGVEDTGQEFQGGSFVRAGQLEEPPVLECVQDAAHIQSVPKRRANHVFTLWVSTP